MTIYSKCNHAAQRLSEKGCMFTELDVIALAGRGSGWQPADWRAARLAANQVMSGRYRDGRLARYGPVNLGYVVDYARKATKIVYADSEIGPEAWHTPNGSFTRLNVEQDPIEAKRGRTSGTDRDDSMPWNQPTHERDGSSMDLEKLAVRVADILESRRLSTA